MSCKFYPHSASSQQSVACDTVRDHIINKTQQQCNQGVDAVKSLRDLQSLNMNAEEPQRQISAKAKPEDATAEQQTFDMKHKIKLQEHDKREMTFKSNLNKAHALVCSHMSPTMESHVKAESDFDGETKDNPVKPLSQTRTLMQDPSRSRHPFASLTEAIRRLINAKMEDQESLISYNEKVKQAKDMFKSHLGIKILDEFIAQTEECKKAVADSNTVLQQEMNNKAFKQWMVFLVTDNTDH